MKYIWITKENIDKEHTGCAMPGKQSVAKKEWLPIEADGYLSFLSPAISVTCIFRYPSRTSPFFAKPAQKVR